MIHILFVIILLITGAIDAATRKIHNLSPLLIALLAILRMICDPTAIRSCIVGFFLLSVPMFLLALLRGGLGGGDIKLTAACGLFLGVDGLLSGFLIAGSLALTSNFICHLYKNRQRKRKPRATMIHPSSFALGPYLSIGFILASFF